MVKVITYGTYDLLHYGHIKLLERAKALGDYLIVGVTADDFDKTRGKINVRQSLMERIEGVRATGLADEIIIEEYEGQKIDDIKRYDIDIFTVGSDWMGKFDYLSEYCQVVYLERTEGVSSSEIRSQRQKVQIGLVGESDIIKKFLNECSFVNGITVKGLCTQRAGRFENSLSQIEYVTNSINDLLNVVDAVYIASNPNEHYKQIKNALIKKKHVICESPLALTVDQCKELFNLARENDCVLIEAIKTAYSTAYSRLLLLAKGGRIGDIVSVDATCTSLKQIDYNDKEELDIIWNSICAWGPTALLPVFQILGVKYNEKRIISKIIDKDRMFDAFTKIDLIYSNAVASIKVGKNVKSEGELIISGTRGYIYVPAPWWKTDYFEIRYENQSENKRFFYQLDGEGIRYEIVEFVKSIERKQNNQFIEENISESISHIIEDYYEKKDLILI